MINLSAAPRTPESLQLAKLVAAGCRSVLEVVALLGELDSALGDGDCGDTFRRGASRVLEAATNFAESNESACDRAHICVCGG